MWRGEKGQTTTEYLMIAGLITAVFLAIYPVIEPRLAQTLQRMAECILNDACP
jgi:Flp pilus assembly pilin Flp